MERRQTLLLQLCSRPDVRRLFPNEFGASADGQLLRILERLWPIVREASASDEECVENMEMLLRITAALADSGRIFFETQ